jgi:hypothetical protein
MNRTFGNNLLLALAASLVLGTLLPTPAGAGTAADETAPPTWRIDGTAYVWFQGVNGDVSALGHQVNIDASPSDLLSYAGLPVEAMLGVQHRRFVAIADGSWTPLTVDTANPKLLPLPPGMAVQVKYSPVIATAEVGYRVSDAGGYAVDALAGARYWYLGATLTLTPSPTGSSVSKSDYWFDPIVGARISKSILPRLDATVMGDIGGFGVGADVDYQVVGALGFKITPTWSLDGAWRQMYADYTQDQLHSKTTESGLVAGVTCRIH